MTAPERAENIANSLLDWYDRNKRDLPWRHAREPYAVWVSEIMAQQTQIATVLSYYERFMRRFPTVRALAEAGEDDVLKAWEGLGYYARARNMQKAARKVVSDFCGQFPRTKEELLTLPGVGDYTAGAILSIAYGIPVPAVDGNVLRVYARVENVDEDVLSPPVKKQASDFVAALTPPERAGCMTQALMELGALVCLPKNPVCQDGFCPAAAFCLAKAYGRQAELPKRTPKKPVKTLSKTVLILRDPTGRVLMRQRAEALLSGLWEFYLLDAVMTAGDVKKHLQTLGFTVKSVTDAGTARHVFTHQIWLMHGYDCAVSGRAGNGRAGAAPAGYRWVEKEDVKDLAIPTAVRFYAEQI